MGIKPGDTVRLHPATDWFMRGVKYATVLKVGRKWVHLEHAPTGTRLKVSHINIL
jgi:hypothetical protein